MHQLSVSKRADRPHWAVGKDQLLQLAMVWSHKVRTDLACLIAGGVLIPCQTAKHRSILGSWSSIIIVLPLSQYLSTSPCLPVP